MDGNHHIAKIQQRACEKCYQEKVWTNTYLLHNEIVALFKTLIQKLCLPHQSPQKKILLSQHLYDVTVCYPLQCADNVYRQSGNN